MELGGGGAACELQRFILELDILCQVGITDSRSDLAVLHNYFFERRQGLDKPH